MSLLTKYSTPAERARGCRWADRFESQALVEENGGTPVNAPTFSVSNGVTLNGTTQYIRYAMLGTEFDSDPLSIVIEFTPTRAADSATAECLFDADNGAGANRHYFWHNVGGATWRIVLNGTTIAEIPEATLTPVWTVGSRNVMVISATTGDTDIWLNGVQVLTNDVTAWTATRLITRLVLGARFVFDNQFGGVVHGFYLFKAKLTAQESLDWYNQDTYRYMESATGVWQMRAADHDPVGNRTLDSSGNGYHVTDVSDPVKIAQRHGYDFDGANDYFFRTGVAADPFDPAGDFSVVVYAKTDKITGGQSLVGKWFEVGNHRSWALRSNNADLYLSMSEDGTAISQTAFASCLAIGNEFVAIGTYEFLTSGTSVVTLYKDDLTPTQITNAGGPCSAEGANANMQISSRDGPLDDWDGEIYYVAFLDGIALTPLQVEDIKIRLKNQRNQV